MISITIDGKDIQLEEPTSVLEAAKAEGIQIPTLCYNEHLSAHGGCRLCMVEMELRPGVTKLVPACSTRTTEGMTILTTTDAVREARKFIMELLICRAPDAPELRRMGEELGVSEDQDVVGDYLLNHTPRREVTDCILCGLCVRACAEIPMRDAISFSKRGIERKVETPFKRFAQSCIGCGSCAYVCPTSAITIEAVG